MMNVGCWNVRGLNSSSRQKEVQYFCNKKSIGVMGLLEHKIKQGKVEVTSNKLCGATNISMNPRGRIWRMWRKEMYDVHVLRTEAQYIHTRMTNKSTQDTFSVTFVYAYNLAAERVVGAAIGTCHS